MLEVISPENPYLRSGYVREVLNGCQATGYDVSVKSQNALHLKLSRMKGNATMAVLNIFVSFEYDKDNDLKNNFFQQAKHNTTHRVENCSLNERYETEEWKRKAQNAIRGCDVVVVLIGDDTHNAPGVIVETDMARSLGKPIIQVRPQTRTAQGLTRLDEPIPWKWARINDELNRIAGG